MEHIEKLKQNILTVLGEKNPARTLVLSMVKSGRITQGEADVILSGFGQTNINFTIDNHVEVNATHWGDIATGNAHIEDGYFGARKENLKRRDIEEGTIRSNEDHWKDKRS